jgi:hypothetical protein
MGCRQEDRVGPALIGSDRKLAGFPRSGLLLINSEISRQTRLRTFVILKAAFFLKLGCAETEVPTQVGAIAGKF